MLQQLTTRVERTMLVEVAAVSVGTGLADATTLVGISALAVALTRGDDTVHVAGMEWGTTTLLLVSLAAAVTRLFLGAWAARRSGALAARVVHRHRVLVIERFLRAPWPHVSSIDIGTLQQISATNSQIAGAHALDLVDGTHRGRQPRGADHRRVGVAARRRAGGAPARCGRGIRDATDATSRPARR